MQNIVATIGRPPIEVHFGENTAEAMRQAQLAAASVIAAQAFSNFRETLAEGIADFAVDEYFSSAETGTLRLYKRIADSPFYQDMGDAAAPLTQLAMAAYLATFIRLDTTSNNLIFGPPFVGALLNNNPAGDHEGGGNSNVLITPNGGGSMTFTYATTVVGSGAGASMVTSHSQTFGGYQAGGNDIDGVGSVAIGVDAGLNSTSLNSAVLIGRHCGDQGNITGFGRVSIGEQNGRSVGDANDLITVGRLVMSLSPASGSGSSVVMGGNTLLKSSALRSVVIGTDIMQSSSGADPRSVTESVLIGQRVGFGIQTSNSDVIAGPFAHFQADGDTSTLEFNVSIGHSAGYLVDGTYCVLLGNRSGAHASKTVLARIVCVGPRVGDVAAGAAALSDHDVRIGTDYTAARTLMWGNTTTQLAEFFHGKFNGTLQATTRVKAGGGAQTGSTPMLVNTPSGTAAAIDLWQDGVEVWRIQNPASTTSLTIGNSGTTRLTISGSTGDVLPGADGTQDLGSASFRFEDIFLENAPTVTSDARTKKMRGDGEATEAERAWAAALRPLCFQLLRSIEEKGEDGARLHWGVIAQEVHQAGMDAGIADPFRYGFLGRDLLTTTEIRTRTEKRQKMREIEIDAVEIEVRGKRAVQVRRKETRAEPMFREIPVFDQAGRKVMVEVPPDKPGKKSKRAQLKHLEPVMEDYEVEYPVEVPLLDEDGAQIDRWNIRYDELIMFAWACGAFGIPEAAS